MTATDTAIRVIDWALSGSGPPPRGDLRNVKALAWPDERLSEALGQLALVSAARLRLDCPPLSDYSALGADSAVLAAALGVLATPELAQLTLRATPPASGPLEWVVRHGLLAPALPHLAAEDLATLREDCLLASPLTALLERPAKGQQATIMNVVQRLLGDPSGRRLLQLKLAEPAPTATVRQWRRDLLERLRLGADADRECVIDVYETAMIHHSQPTLEQTRAARALLADSTATEAQLQEALAIAAWWGPLAALERSHPDALRARRYLGYAYREGIALYRVAQRLAGGLV